MPWLHCKHEVAPGAAAYVLGGQLLQLTPSTENDPTGQGVHWLSKSLKSPCWHTSSARKQQHNRSSSVNCCSCATCNISADRQAVASTSKTVFAAYHLCIAMAAATSSSVHSRCDAAKNAWQACSNTHTGAVPAGSTESHFC